MKIGLISPKGSFLSNDPQFKSFWENSDFLHPYKYHWSGISLGLLILAALTPPEFDVEVIDEHFDVIDFNKDYDLVAISAMTQQSLRAYEIADEFRRREKVVVIGGIHATLLRHEAKEHADSVVVGEGERIWPVILDDFLTGRLRPYYISEQPIDLRQSPIPRYDLLDSRNYNVVWVQTSRGCPHDCDFCASSKIFGRKFRYKEIDQIVEEIKFIKQLFKNITIDFTDDNMFVNRGFSVELLKKLKGLNIKWRGETDISIADDQGFLRLLKESGCQALLVGLESVNKPSLRFLDKGNWKFRMYDKYTSAIENIQSLGIGIIGAFILGFDEDDYTIFRETADFIIKNKLYGANISILTPFPGTRLRERLEKEKRILSNDWSNYTIWDVNFVPKKMTVNQLQEGMLATSMKVYNAEVRQEVAAHFKDIYCSLTRKVS